MTTMWRLKFQLEKYDKRVANFTGLVSEAQRDDKLDAARMWQRKLNRALAQRAKIATEMLERIAA